MKLKIGLALFILSTLLLQVKGQLTPKEAAKLMVRGINLGNTLDAPNGEGTWGTPIVAESIFDDYKNAGFTCVRIPVTWDKHTGTTSPYKINATWLNRVEQIVDWGLKRNLIIIINAHHDGWIKDSYSAANVIRFDSIWSQVATRFKNKSENLLFEVINEPNPMTLANINDLNARTIKTIRKTNPTRIVLFSGHMWSNSQELLAAAVPVDNYLMGYYHSYDPYPFGLEGTGSYGTDSDISTTNSKFAQVAAWGKQHNMPVVLGEFGATYKCDYNSRMCVYATVVEKALVYNVPFCAWEDGGDFKFYDRTGHKWTEIKDILIHTYKESPYKMKIGVVSDTLVKILWTNRTTKNDSIIVERKIGSGNFTFLEKISPTANQYVDSTTNRGKTFYYRLRANLMDSIEIQSYPIMYRILPSYRASYLGTALALPGTVQVENYDIGGEGLTYHDIDEANQGKAYRLNDGVDLNQYTTGKYSLGYVATGEWLEYTINVPKAGNYTISAYVGSPNTGGQFTLKFKNGTTSAFAVSSTGSYSTFKPISKNFALLEGEQIMRLYITQTPDFDLDYINFSFVTAVNYIVQDEVSVFPNPARDQLFINGLNKSATVKIYSTSGVLVASKIVNGHDNFISISNLEDAVYIVKITSENKNWTKKILKSSK